MGKWLAVAREEGGPSQGTYLLSQGLSVAPYITRREKGPSLGWESSVCRILNILFENTVGCHLTPLETPAQPLGLHIYAKQNANEPVEPFVSIQPSWEPGSPDKLLLPAFILSRKAFLIRTWSL